MVCRDSHRLQIIFEFGINSFYANNWNLIDIEHVYN